MNTKEWFKSRLEELKDDFDFRLEGFILHLTEDICKRMKDKDMNRTEFAGRLNVSPPAVTKILNGSSNFTLRTLLSIADALEYELDIKFVEKDSYGYVLNASTLTTSGTVFPYDPPHGVGIGETWTDEPLPIYRLPVPGSEERPILEAA